jgi:hypothetical protein
MATMTRNHGYPRRSGYARKPNDCYVEPRWCVNQVLDVEPMLGGLLDPCAGIGTIFSVCRSRGLAIEGSDIRDYGCGFPVRDLFSITKPVDNIISNVPYGIAEKCARHMLTLVHRKLLLILPLTFLESQRRRPFFLEYPPIRVYPCSERPSMPPPVLNGPRDKYGCITQPMNTGGTAPYAWFVWEPGFHGAPTIEWLPLRPRARARPLGAAGRASAKP